MGHFIGIGDKQYRVDDDGTVRTMDGRPVTLNFTEETVEELIPTLPNEQQPVAALCTESSMKVKLKRRRTKIRRRRKLIFKPLQET